MVNVLLGVVYFGLVVYFMMLMKPQGSSSTAKGGGKGNKGGKGRKGKMMLCSTDRFTPVAEGELEE